ncbi:hypothetical protein [Paenibacillus piscarius]|nr:hypothetical protein [Paenibacillus piscarius]
MKLLNKLYSEYLVIPRPFRLLMLWGWIVLLFVAAYKLDWLYWMSGR